MKIFKGKLKRVTSTHNNLRTDEVVGEYAFPPEVGKRFTLLGESLDPDFDYRFVTTTEVKTVETAGETTRFTTANSTYELTNEKA